MNKGLKQKSIFFNVTIHPGVKGDWYQLSFSVLSSRSWSLSAFVFCHSLHVSTHYLMIAKWLLLHQASPLCLMQKVEVRAALAMFVLFIQESKSHPRISQKNSAYHFIVQNSVPRLLLDAKEADQMSIELGISLS